MLHVHRPPPASIDNKGAATHACYEQGKRVRRARVPFHSPNPTIGNARHAAQSRRRSHFSCIPQTNPCVITPSCKDMGGMRVTLCTETNWRENKQTKQLGEKQALSTSAVLRTRAHTCTHPHTFTHTSRYGPTHPSKMISADKRCFGSRWRAQCPQIPAFQQPVVRARKQNWGTGVSVPGSGPYFGGPVVFVMRAPTVH